MDMSVIVPAYNEEASVGETLEQLKSVLSKSGLSFEVICIDDGSRDKSAAIIAGVRGIRSLRNPYNLGYGATLKRGLKEAAGEYVMIVDADGSYPIGQAPLLLEHMRSYDMVVGARDRTNVPIMRKPAKFIIRSLVNFVAGMLIPDENSGMRVFRKEMAMRFLNLYPDRFSFTITLTLASVTKGYTLKFVPIGYHKRKGVSSMRSRNFFEFLGLIFRIVTYFSPFKVFSLVSLALLAMAIGIFLYTRFSLGRVMDITVIVVALSALQIFLFGLVADIIAKKD